MSLEMTNFEDHLKDRTRPVGPWQFDEEVTRVFDDMLRRSIPQHDVMRKSVFDLGASYVHPGATIVDCGASRGEAIAPFVDLLGTQGRCVCIEVSESMLRSLHARFYSGIRNGSVELHPLDLRHEYPDVVASLTLSVLTLQFTPMEYRRNVVRRIYETTQPGGAFILVEKIQGESTELNQLMIETYHRYKLDHGYSPEEVARKALSLEGVLVPATARWNVEILKDAGFDHVDCFWRWMNFAGWIAVKS